MPTITAGSSVEIDIAVGESYAVSAPLEAYVDIVSGTAGAGYKTDRLVGNSQRTQIYGPYPTAVKIRVRARTGGATYYAVPKEQPESPDLVDVKARISASGMVIVDGCETRSFVTAGIASGVPTGNFT